MIASMIGSGTRQSAQASGPASICTTTLSWPVSSQDRSYPSDASISRNLPSAPSRVLATASLVIGVPHLRDRRRIAARPKGLDHGGNAGVVGSRDHELDGRGRVQ